MRYLILLFALVLTGTGSRSQDSTIAFSRFETFAGKANVVLKTEIREAGFIGWRKLYLLKATDLASGASAAAIRLGDNQWGAMPVLIDSRALILDLDELNAVVPVLERFGAEPEKPRPAANLHFSYTTSNDVVFFCSYDRQTDVWQYGVGKVYKHLRTYVPQTFETLTKKRFAELVKLLKEVQAAAP